MENSPVALVDDVDTLIGELEVQFGDAAILPENTLAGPTMYCTFTPSCNH